MSNYLLFNFRFSVFGLFAVIISWLTASIYLTAAVVSSKIYYILKPLYYVYDFNDYFIIGVR